MDTRGLIKVELHVPVQREEEFHAWCELEHVGQILAMNGIVSGRRYYCDDAFPKFLALYETVDESAEQSPSWKRLGSNPTPWSRRMATFFGQSDSPTRRRQNFRKQIDTRHKGGHPGAVYVVDCASSTATADMFRAMATEATAVPGCTGYRFLEASAEARALEIFDLKSEAVVQTREWQALMRGPTASVLAAASPNATRHLYLATGSPILNEKRG